MTCFLVFYFLCGGFDALRVRFTSISDPAGKKLARRDEEGCWKHSEAFPPCGFCLSLYLVDSTNINSNISQQNKLQWWSVCCFFIFTQSQHATLLIFKQDESHLLRLLMQVSYYSKKTKKSRNDCINFDTDWHPSAFQKVFYSSVCVPCSSLFNPALLGGWMEGTD